MTSPAAEYSRDNLFSDPIYRYLRITKGGPGGVPGQASEQDLIDAAWLQRLRRIHQLQSAWWVFATAEHSRFQHALGAMHLAGDWTRHLYPTLATAHRGTPSAALVEETMRMAGLLHDVGHGPFGHFFDENYLDRWGIDHEDIGRALVGGPLAELIGALEASPTADFASGERIDPRWVQYLISPDDLGGFKAPTWLAALKPAMVGPFSADNLDYVPRDAYICGVAAGPVDVQRILHYSFISERGLTSITRSTSTARSGASTCSCARCSGRRLMCCSAATRWSGWTSTRRSLSGRFSPRSTAGPAPRTVGSAGSSVVLGRTSWRAG